jgi:hypothetical protein
MAAGLLKCLRFPVLCYGASALEAMGKAQALALRALAERIERGENQTGLSPDDL